MTPTPVAGMTQDFRKAPMMNNTAMTREIPTKMFLAGSTA